MANGCERRTIPRKGVAGYSLHSGGVLDCRWCNHLGETDMTTEPKLLTEAEARGAWQATYATHTMSITEYFAALRERGLIAEEPVDPVLEEAREICGEAMGVDYTSETTSTRGALLATYNALRRGREIGLAERPTLTREVVRKACNDLGWYFPENSLDHLHAAILERLQ